MNRIAVDGMVTIPMEEWNQIARNYNRLIATLESLADSIGHEGLSEVKAARAAVKEARDICNESQTVR